MAKFNEMSAEELHEITSKGGKARANQKKEKGKTFEEVVKEEITNEDLKELYRGMLNSGKKGNVKAVEAILKYLEANKQPTDSFDNF